MLLLFDNCLVCSIINLPSMIGSVMIALCLLVTCPPHEDKRSVGGKDGQKVATRAPLLLSDCSLTDGGCLPFQH